MDAVRLEGTERGVNSFVDKEVDEPNVLEEMEIDACSEANLYTHSNAVCQ